MKTLQDKVDQLSELVRIYSNFLEIWKDKIPDGCSATFGTVGSARLNFFCYADDRQTVLAKVADAFGRDGWTRKKPHTADTFDWTKRVNELEVYINYAEVVELNRPDAVQPKEFPLALTEVSV